MDNENKPSMFNYKNTIGHLLFKKIFLGYITFVLIFTSYQIYKEYTYANKLIKKDLINIEKSFSKVLSKAVWHFEENKIYDQVDAIIDSKIITGIVILTPENEVIARKGTLENSVEKYNEFVFDIERNSEVSFFESLTKHEFELIDVSNKEEELLGKVILFVKTNEIMEMAKEAIILILINVFISALVLWGLFIYFANKVLAVPLNQLIHATQDLKAKEYHQVEISLNTESKHELNTLAETFNEMGRRINETYVNLKQLTIIQEKQKKDLEDANKYKTDFLANMSHELKTPLNSINVISSVMMKNKDNSLNEKQVKNLQIINSCGNDLLYLINDVLDISKLEAGEVSIDYTQLNAANLMAQIKDMFSPQVKEKNINFNFSCASSIGDIYSDENRIKQIIKNLLSNALKFVSEGKSIDFVIEDLDKFVQVKVIDEGIGISKEKLDHIFDRFKQADGSTTRKYGGTGLGLAICKELLHLLEGEISVESEVNVGTTFTVLIPKNKEKVNVQEENKNETLEEKEVLNKQKVLVLNNDPVAFMSLIIDLKNRFEISQSSTLKEFVQIYRSESFDCVIIDISNENMNDIKKLVRLIDKKIIIIYKDSIEDEVKNAVFASISKPINKDLVLQKVEE